MNRLRSIVVACMAVAGLADSVAADEPKPAEGAPQTAGASFMKDVAPILVQNCIACHNARKAESKYNMTTFTLLAKGGQQGEEITLIPQKPEESRFVELLLPDGEPRMPYKQDPLPKEKIDVIERWVKEGAKYDGTDPNEDWVALLHKTTPVVVPDAYPVTIPITAVVFSPDGNSLGTSGYHELNLWKIADGSLTRRVRGVPERLYDVAYSPDGKWLATAGGDPGQYGTAKLFIAEPDGGGKPVRELVESNDAIFAVAFSPDSKLVAAAGADRAIRIWEVESGNLVATIEDHADWILDLAFSPDGKRLASASRDKTSKVFDVVKKESLVTFPGHAETVYTVAFSPDGKLVTTGGGDNQIRLWNPDEEAKQTAAIGGFGGAVFRLVYHPDGKHLLATGADKIVRVFANNAQVRAFPPHNDWVYSLAVSPDGSTVAAGSWDGEVRLNKFADGAAVRTILAAPGFTPQPPVQAAAK